MKKLVLIIALFCFLLSCNRGKEKASLTGYTKRTIHLINGLGTVSVYLPDEIDSAYSFTDSSTRWSDRYTAKIFHIDEPKSNLKNTPNITIPLQLEVWQSLNKSYTCSLSLEYCLLKGTHTDFGLYSPKKLYYKIINNRKFVVDETSYPFIRAITSINNHSVNFSFNYIDTNSLNTIEIKPDSILK